MFLPKSCYNEPCYKEVEIIVSHVSHVEMYPFANYFPWLGRRGSSSFEVSETNMRNDLKLWHVKHVFLNLF